MRGLLCSSRQGAGPATFLILIIRVITWCLRQAKALLILLTVQRNNFSLYFYFIKSHFNSLVTLAFFSDCSSCPSFLKWKVCWLVFMANWTGFGMSGLGNTTLRYLWQSFSEQGLTEEEQASWKEAAVSNGLGSQCEWEGKRGRVRLNTIPLLLHPGCRCNVPSFLLLLLLCLPSGVAWIPSNAGPKQTFLSLSCYCPSEGKSNLYYLKSRFPLWDRCVCRYRVTFKQWFHGVP